MTRYKAFCPPCGWSFAVATKAMAEHLVRIHNGACPSTAGKVGEMTAVVEPPTDRDTAGGTQ